MINLIWLTFFFVFKIRFLWASKDFSKDVIGQVELTISNFLQFIEWF